MFQAFFKILMRFYAKSGKTNKAIASRFTMTYNEEGRSVLTRLASGTNHNTRKKSCGAKGRLRGLKQVDEASHKKYISRLLVK
jgi:ribosomal protein L35